MAVSQDAEPGQNTIVPKLVVFDLDYTLWPFWCDTHVVPPVKPVPDGNSVYDKRGDHFSFYKEVPQILEEIKDDGSMTICLASRTGTPRIAQNILSHLKVGDQPASSFFLYTAWGTGSKVGHLQELHRLTGVEFQDMVLYDDEMRNRDVERKLGVTFVEVPNGLTRDLFYKGFEDWRKRNGLKQRNGAANGSGNGIPTGKGNPDTSNGTTNGSGAVVEIPERKTKSQGMFPVPGQTRTIHIQDELDHTSGASGGSGNGHNGFAIPNTSGESDFE